MRSGGRSVFVLDDNEVLRVSVKSKQDFESDEIIGVACDVRSVEPLIQLVIGQDTATVAASQCVQFQLLQSQRVQLQLVQNSLYSWHLLADAVVHAATC